MSLILTSSPTVANIDQNYLLTVNWQPAEAPSGAYTAYLGWNIATIISNVATITFTNGLDFGGTVSSPSFEEPLTIGDYAIDMYAVATISSGYADSTWWDGQGTWTSTFKFPSDLVGMVSYDNSTLLLGQTLTITLNDSYSATGVSAWQVIYGDGTASGWLPMTSRTNTKIYTTAGLQNIVVQVLSDYSMHTPAVKLTRSFAFPVFVMNQQYSAASSTSITGTLGVGGESGFEIVDNTSVVTTPADYEVIVRSLVRDTVTNELKLLVATSRYPNASSLLGTMALDVFPLSGRPQAKELLEPLTEVTVSNSSATPVKITTISLPGDAYIGIPVEYFKFMTATGGIAPYSWFATNLPTGLRMSIDGTISGTPIALGNFDVNFAVMDSSFPAYIAETTLTFTIPSNLAITTASLLDATVLTPYGVQMANTGGLLPFTWSVEAGALPIGLILNPSTGLISGVPCSYSVDDFASDFSVTIQIQDAVGALASRSYTLQLFPAALQLGTADQPIIYAGQSFELEVPVFGGKSPYVKYAFTDDGMAALDPNSAEAQYGGNFEFTVNVPTTQASKVHNFTVTIKDSAYTPVTKTIYYTVSPEVNNILVTEPCFDHTWVSADTETLAYLIAGPLGGFLINQGSSFVVPSSDFSQVDGLIVTVNPDFQGTLSPPVSPPLTGDPVVEVAGPPSAYCNSEVKVSIPLTNGTATSAIISREFELLTSGTATSTYTRPYIVGDFVALDPQRPYFNSPHVPNAGWFYVRMKTGSALPTGLSLDQYAGMIYGTLLATYGSLTGGSNVSILEYVNASDVVIQTITVYWDTLANSFSLSPSLPSGTIQKAYTGSIATSSPSNLASASAYRGTIPSGLNLSIPTAFSSVPTGTTLIATLTASKLNAVDNMSIALGPVGLGTYYTFVWQGDNQLVIYSYTPGQAVVATGDYVSWTAGSHTLVLTVVTGATNTLSATFDGVHQFGNTDSSVSLASAACSYSYTGTLTTSLLSSPTLGPAPATGTTATLTGTPMEAGYFDLWLELTNSNSNSAYVYQRLAVTYATPLTILTASLPAIVSTIAYSQTLQGYGGVAPYTWAWDVVTSFPAISGIINLNPSTGGITGTYSGSPAGPANVTFTVTDSNGTVATRILALSVSNIPVITTAAIPPMTLGVPYTFTIQASGGIPSYTWSETGSLPTGTPGITLNSATGVLSGTATQSGYGTVPILFKVTDSNASFVTKSLNITVGIASGMTIDASGVGPIYRGVSYLGTLAIEGVTISSLNPGQWTVTADPHSLFTTGGLTLTNSVSNYGATSRITGLYTGPAFSNWTFNVQATDQTGHMATAIVTISATSNLVITPATLPNATINVALSGPSYHLTVTGGGSPTGGAPVYTWSIPTPPGGFPFVLTSGGVLTGTSSSVGTWNFIAQVTDAMSPVDTAQQGFSIKVTSSTLAMSALTPATATAGVSYTGTITGSGGVPPYSWSLVSGSIPSGMTFTGWGGTHYATVSGTTSNTGTFTFTIQLEDNASAIVQQQFTLTVSSGLSLFSGIDYTNSISTGSLGYVTSTGNVGTITGPNDSFFVIATGVIATVPGNVLVGAASSVGTFTGIVESITGGVALIKLSGPFGSGASGSGNAISVTVTDTGSGSSNIVKSKSFTWTKYTSPSPLTVGPTSGGVPSYGIPLLEGVSGDLPIYNSGSSFTFQTYNGQSVSKSSAASAAFSFTASPSTNAVTFEYDGGSGNFLYTYAGASFPSGVALTTATLLEKDIAWYSPANGFDVYASGVSATGDFLYMVHPSVNVTTTVTVPKTSTSPGSSGPNLPGTEAAVSSSFTAWTSTGYLHEGGEDTIVLYGGNDTVSTSQVLNLINFGLNVPSNATISSVTVFANLQQSAGSSVTYFANKSGTTGVTLIGATAATQTGMRSNAGNTFIFYPSGLTPAQANASSFGVSLQLNCTELPGTGANLELQSVTITVNYTVPNLAQISVNLSKPFSPQQQGIGASGNSVTASNVAFTNGVIVYSVTTNYTTIGGQNWLSGWTIAAEFPSGTSSMTTQLSMKVSGNLTYLSGTSIVTGTVTYINNATPIATITANRS